MNMEGILILKNYYYKISLYKDYFFKASMNIGRNTRNCSLSLKGKKILLVLLYFLSSPNSEKPK
jgi:hypothetical protein